MLKIHPDLALISLRDKRDREYRLWTLARALDSEGSGRVPVDRLTVFASTLRGLSPGTVRRLLDAGDGAFWDRYTKAGKPWIRLRGLAPVCEALGVEKLRHDPVLLPDRSARTLRAWRSAIFATLFGRDFGTPISRRVLEELTGRSPRTQRNYQAAMGKRMQGRQNAAVSGEPWKPAEDPPDGHFVDYVNGKLVILRRLPNSYKAKLKRGRRGMTRRVNKTLNARKPVRICGTGEQPQSRRLFYTEPSAAQRRLQAKQEGDQFFVAAAELNGRPAKQSRCGAALWSRWTVTDERVFCV